jgi:endonuclease/exonuclease/phosphatase family metal-dependent hydrolase
MKIPLSCLLVIAVLLLSCSQKTVTNSDSSTKQNDSAELYKKGIVAPKDYKLNQSETIKILSWNVEHFVDAYDNPYINNQRENNSNNMKGRVNLLVKALREADADIVVLQEFESIQFLKQIANEHLSDMGYAFFADHESINWYMNVVVMSKIPLGITYGYASVNTPVQYKDEDTGEDKYETQSRINTRLWSVDVLVNDDYSFVLTGVHLKAGRGARNEAMRLGQLQFLKGQFERFLQENAEKNILVVGDFNSTPSSEEMRFMKDGNSTAKFIDFFDDNTLTHPADNPNKRIDYILPNTQMSKEMVKGSLKVNYFFEKNVQRQLSDHLPLTAEFISKDVP